MVWVVTIGSGQQKLPYPIIFVHGLTSDNTTWTSTINSIASSLGVSYDLDAHVLHFVLNAYNGLNPINGYDGEFGTIDDDVLFLTTDINGFAVNTISRSDVYAVNFDNFWNQVPMDPKIMIHNGGQPSPASSESDGNESSIYKQAYALKMAIAKVRLETGSDKVILVGHSMGGLAIREYLQRIENGNHKWWINPGSSDGHKVAKVVTIGTPHLGSNFGETILSNEKNKHRASDWIPNLFSEAVRDLRYRYVRFLPGTKVGTYLFGGTENTISDFSGFHNNDVNCDGDEADDIAGINEGAEGTYDNQSQPLPLNILYRWITSDEGTTGDGIVDLNRQWLHSSFEPFVSKPDVVSDTIMTNKFHINETSDYRVIMRGLDEPNTVNGAYSVKLNRSICGFITYGSFWDAYDIDYYHVVCPGPGTLTVTLFQHGSPATNLTVTDGSVPVGSLNSSIPLQYECNTESPQNLYVKIEGNATSTSHSIPYEIEVSFSGITNGTVFPSVGTPADLYVFTSKIYAPSSTTSADISVIVDGTTNTMNQQNSTWAIGASFSCGKNYISGHHTYFFEGVINGKLYRFPASGSLSFDVTGSPSTNKNVVISEIYGGGGNVFSHYNTDYVELYNPTDTPISMDGWSIQKASLSGPSWAITVLNGTIRSHGYYLVEEDSGNGSHQGDQVAIPSPDVIGLIPLGQLGNKIALVSSTNMLSGFYPIRSDIVDFVGYGPTNGYDGSGPGPSTSNVSAVERKATQYSDSMSMTHSEKYLGNGFDTDDNRNDFVLSLPEPQNASSSTETVPVELVSFTGKVVAKDARLEWKTATEVNNHGFSIERSTNGVWSTIGFVPGAGTSNVPHNYFYGDNSVAVGSYAYRLKQIDNDGAIRYSEEIVLKIEVVLNKVSLEQNYPNPFNPSTIIKYSIPKETKIQIVVFDLIGREIEVLVDATQHAGVHQIIFDARSIPSGMYYYRLITSEYTETKRLVVMH